MRAGEDGAQGLGSGVMSAVETGWGVAGVVGGGVAGVVGEVVGGGEDVKTVVVTVGFGRRATLRVIVDPFGTATSLMSWPMTVPAG